jgi:hypothetical protein
MLIAGYLESWAPTLLASLTLIPYMTLESSVDSYWLLLWRAFYYWSNVRVDKLGSGEEQHHSKWEPILLSKMETKKSQEEGR